MQSIICGLSNISNIIIIIILEYVFIGVLSWYSHLIAHHQSKVNIIAYTFKESRNIYKYPVGDSLKF